MLSSTFEQARDNFNFYYSNIHPRRNGWTANYIHIANDGTINGSLNKTIIDNIAHSYIAIIINKRYSSTITKCESRYCNIFEERESKTLITKLTLKELTTEQQTAVNDLLLNINKFIYLRQDHRLHDTTFFTNGAESEAVMTKAAGPRF